MRSRTFGWEIDLADNKPVTRVIPITRPIIIRAFQVHVAYMKGPTASLWSPKPGFAQVLAWGAISNVQATDAFGVGRFLAGAPASAHGNENDGFLFNTIIKCEVSNNGGSANSDIFMTKLEIPVNQTNELMLCMAHGGVPSDVEMQMVLFFDDGK